MSDPIDVPDFVPTDLLAEHLDAARAQVEARLSRPQGGTAVASLPVTPPEPPAVALAPALPGQAMSRAPHAFLAAALALVGLIVLTCMWTWLALTHDPLWWWFVIIGGTLTAVAAGWLAVLEERDSDDRSGRARGSWFD